MNLPTVKQLRYFVALETHGHFGRAAQACFVSQSAFSVAIRDFERLLGAQLVDRSGKQVTITASGREVAARARDCLREMEELVRLAGSGRDPLAGKLRLGVIPTIAPFLLPKVLPALREVYPRLRLYLHEDLTRRIYEKLMAGELDLILIALPYALRNVELMGLFDDPFRLAAHEHSRLVDPRHYSVADLPPESVLLLEDGHCLRDHALSACEIRKPEQVSGFAASSLLTLVEMVDADLGITYLPQMAVASPLLKSTRIRTWPLAENSVREIGLAWRRGSAFGEAFRELGEFIRAHRAQIEGEAD
ncbi:MAG TPA: hydrogen peroxide-inducible genes activator [Gammaproteobacteria bacterium]|nr:hydrogen peroxide-inducible genes activator [Gammaproteobacteria bacterium]